jgi:hypothetical protein
MLEQSDSIDPNILLILFKIIYFMVIVWAKFFLNHNYSLSQTKSLNKLFNWILLRSWFFNLGDLSYTNYLQI